MNGNMQADEVRSIGETLTDVALALPSHPSTSTPPWLAGGQEETGLSWRTMTCTAHSIHEGRYLFQNNPIQKYPKLKELPGRGLLNIKNQ